MELNFAQIVIYFSLLIMTIFVSFYVIRGLYTISVAPPINAVVGELRDYTLTTKQPVMILPNYVYMGINLPIAHQAYTIYLCFVAAVLAATVLFWLIGLVIKKIFLLGKHPLENVNFLVFFWGELNDMHFFEWLFEKTLIDKNKDIINFILNIFRAFLTPEEFEIAQKRCLENFVSKPKPSKSSGVNSQFQLSPPYKEYIDYDLRKEYPEDKLEDKFYMDSYKSIKQREAANIYRKMVIIQPDTVNNLRMPEIDFEEMININKSYAYI
jgi:hypothetical protein